MSFMTYESGGGAVVKIAENRKKRSRRFVKVIGNARGRAAR